MRILRELSGCQPICKPVLGPSDALLRAVALASLSSPHPLLIFHQLSIMYVWTPAKAVCKTALKAEPKRVIQFAQTKASNLWGLVITLIAAFALEQSPFFVWVSSLPCTDAFLIWMPTPNSSGPPLHSTSLNKAWHSSLYSIGLGLPHKTHRYSNSKDHAPLEFSFYLF